MNLRDPGRFALLLFLLLLLLRPLAGEAAEETAGLGLDEMEGIFTEIVLENSPWPREDVRIANFTARPISLGLPPGAMTWRVGQKPQDSRPGRKTVAITILVDGNEQGQVRMSGDLQLFADVVCTSRRLARNDIIGAGDIMIARQDISLLDTGLVLKPEQVLGQKLKTSLRAGAVLFTHLLESPPLVSRGELVTIAARSDAVRVTAPGEARNTGALGETIKVKNLMSRREIFARVAGPGLVETEF